MKKPIGEAILHSQIKYVFDPANSRNFISLGYVLQTKDGMLVFKVSNDEVFEMLKEHDSEADIEFIKRYLGYIKAEFEKDTKPGNLRKLTNHYVNQFQFDVREVVLPKEMVNLLGILKR